MSLFYKQPPELHCPGLFPPLEKASENGVLAYGGDLRQKILLDAYQLGIFPWPYPDAPLLWCSPDPRCLILPREFHITSRSARKIRNSGFQITFNQAFPQVIRNCARPRKGKAETWIDGAIIAAYENLYRAGYAQSVEVWQEGELAGGLYGVCMGRAFFGESMFHFAPEASRAAVQALVATALALDFLFIDCQQETPHMLAMGARMFPRREFQKLLRKAMEPCGNPGSCQL